MATLAEVLGLPPAVVSVFVEKGGRVQAIASVLVSGERKVVQINSEVPDSVIGWAKKNADDVMGSRRVRVEYILRGAKAWEFLGRAGLLTRQCSAKEGKIIV